MDLYVTNYRSPAVVTGKLSFPLTAYDFHIAQLEQQLWQTKEQLETMVAQRTKELASALNAKSAFLAIMSHGTTASRRLEAGTL